MKKFSFLIIFLSLLSFGQSQIALPYIQSFDPYTTNQPLNGDGGIAASGHVYVTPYGVVGNCAEFQMTDTAASLYDTITSPIIGPLTANTATSFYFRAINFSGSVPTVYHMTGRDQAIIYVGTSTFNLAIPQYTIDSADQNQTTGYIKITVAAPSWVSGLSGRFRIITSNPDGHNWRLEFDSLVVRDTLSAAVPPGLSSVVTNVTCRGLSTGAIHVTATGGAPYTYLWSTGQSTDTISGLAAGVYTVTVTDSLGGVGTLTDTVSQPAFALLLDSLSKTPAACYGASTGAATIYASGGTLPYHYTWNTTPTTHTDSAENLAAGNYNVTVTDASGCQITATTHISQPSVALTSITSSTASTGSNGTATVIANGGTSPFSYVWSSNPPQTTAIATGLAPGLYEVTVTDGGGCRLTDTVFVPYPAGINAISSQDFTIYPNPASDKVFVKIQGGSMTPCPVEIRDISGRLVLSEGACTGTINTSILSDGIYTLKINANDQSYIMRLIIQR